MTAFASARRFWFIRWLDRLPAAAPPQLQFPGHRRPMTLAASALCAQSVQDWTQMNMRVTQYMPLGMNVCSIPCRRIRVR
jgi:hypothetical protein